MVNNEKSMFHEALTFLIQSANMNSGHITVEEINSAFDGIIDDDSKYSLIYNYLSENNITVDGYDYNSSAKTENTLNTSDDISDTSETDTKTKMFLDMYYNDIKNITAVSEDDEFKLLNALVNNNGTDDKEVINTLIEANLNMVINQCEAYINKGLPLIDLIQEGNIGLIEGINTYNDEPDLTDFHSHLTICIKNALESAVFEQSISNRVNSHVVDRANELDRASVELSKELDRTPTLEELSEYLSLPSDEIEQIMKMSLNALTINEDTE